MLEIIKKIIENVLSALYETFGFALMIAVLFMFLYMFAKEKGWKIVVQCWWEMLKKSVTFRRVFFFVLYTAMILFRTLLNRSVLVDPLTNIIGVWGMYDLEGQMTTQAIENLILFIPFTVLLFCGFQEKLIGKTARFWSILWKSILIVFLCSLSIEFLQMFLRLGTFQLSDLFYNTLGGLVGGLIYWILFKIGLRKK